MILATRLIGCSCACMALLCSAPLPALAIGARVDVRVVDRDTGETLRPVLHRGEWWVAGRPGARYGVLLRNRGAGRTLSVLSIDGVNAISGEDADWTQTGYVLGARDRARIDGWRKSESEVAAFEFTRLPDSYAARTGRPANVGVIGVAVFEERRPLAAPARSMAASPSSRSRAPEAEARGDDAAASPVAGEKSLASVPREERLGTGHGAIEASAITFVDFRRAHATPDETIVLHYDRLENLIARGVFPASTPSADPFPAQHRFVPDPPARD